MLTYSFRSLASKGFPSECSKSVCMATCTQNTPNLQCWFLKRRLTNTPRRHRLADGQLSSLYPPSSSFRSFDAGSVMCSPAPPVSSSTLTAVCVLPEYRSGRKYKVHLDILWLSKCPLYFQPDVYREVRLELYGANARVLSLVLPSLPLTPQRHRQADGQLSSLYPPSPSFSSFGAACVKLCCLPPPSLVRNIRLCCLV